MVFSDELRHKVLTSEEKEADDEHGNFADDILFSMLRSDWEEKRRR